MRTIWTRVFSFPSEQAWLRAWTLHFCTDAFVFCFVLFHPYLYLLPSDATRRCSFRNQISSIHSSLETISLFCLCVEAGFILSFSLSVFVSPVGHSDVLMILRRDIFIRNCHYSSVYQNVEPSRAFLWSRSAYEEDSHRHPDKESRMRTDYMITPNTDFLIDMTSNFKSSICNKECLTQHPH